MKITARYYNSIFGFETDYKEYGGNGFIFCSAQSGPLIVSYIGP
jgi:hypothetical protein